MKYVIEYTAEDFIAFEELDEDTKLERTYKIVFTSKNKAIGFCQGIEALNGYIIKKYKE